MTIIIQKIVSSFIEGILVGGVGPGALGTRIHIKKILFIACIHAPMVYLIRQVYDWLQIPLGTHVFFIMVEQLLLLRFIGKQKMLDSIIATLINTGIILFGEVTFLIPFLKIIGVDMETLFQHPFAYSIAVLIAFLPFMIAFIIVYICKVTLIDLNNLRYHQDM